MTAKDVALELMKTPDSKVLLRGPGKKWFSVTGVEAAESHPNAVTFGGVEVWEGPKSKARAADAKFAGPEIRPEFLALCRAVERQERTYLDFVKDVEFTENGVGYWAKLYLTVGYGYFSGSLLIAEISRHYPDPNESPEYRMITRPLEKGVDLFLAGTVPGKNDPWVED